MIEVKLKNLSIFEFNNFSYNHPLGSYHQTSSYALFASEQGYDYDLLGFVDNDGKIYAASLILSKKIGSFNRYGYAPKGFLIDYYDYNLIKEFISALKKYYYNGPAIFICSENVVFIVTEYVGSGSEKFLLKSK